jgi:hypothetical protein
MIGTHALADLRLIVDPHATVVSVPPSSWREEANNSALRATATTLAPWACKAEVIARPKPRLAPVTDAVELV